MSRAAFDPRAMPLVQKIMARQATLTRSERVVAAYLTAHARDIPFETAASIARRTGVSQMTVGRFLRSLGYGGLTPLKEELNSLNGVAWLVGERYRRIAASGGRDGGSDGEAGGRDLAQSLDLELKAVVSAYELARTPRFTHLAQRVAHADRVYIAGFQTVRGVALDFAQRLEYARPGVHFLDGANGTYAELFTERDKRRLLIVIDIRRYAQQAALLVREAAECGIDLAAVTDAVCCWAQEHTEDVFPIPTEVDLFWDSNGPITTFLNLLVDETIRQIGPPVSERLATLQRLQDKFDAFLK